MRMHPRDRRRRSSMALVITLLILAVITILILALFAGASQQAVSAESAAMQAREKMLADSAVALVIGQIATASTQTNQAWISQPGLLRNYSTNAARAPAACYKLYSTPTLAGMVDTSGNLAFLSNDIPANWSNTPSLYTDINSPSQTPGAEGQAIYPVLDPAATNPATGVAGVSSDNGSVAMPVAWLYELQDGTLGTTTNATAANPIVARVAFWTDDDTCKVNINTAGCGSPCNVPRSNTTNDAAWSTNEPAQGEYSGYPGHPATTSLAVVFGTNTFTPQQLLAFSPRYGWGGSAFGTQPTTNGETVTPKLDRLYASLDELCFGTKVDSSGDRETNGVTAAQLETARFVLTAHSVAPETTLLGEPRVAIWPIADSTSATAPRLTATDAAITNAATVGEGTTNTRGYYFVRNSPLNSQDDFNPAATNSPATTNNLQLFGDLLNRGTIPQPGYGTATMTTKYSGAQWTQIMLEIADYIHALNAVDPTPAPFVPFAGGDTNHIGYGFVEPLTTTYGTGTNTIGLRGFGRCPTLSSLTLVFYVTGFNFKNGTHIDYEETPDTNGASWQANFLPASTNWANVTAERVRAFAIPCTYQPACGYPEVSDACTIQIKGLDALKLVNYTNTASPGFSSNATSHELSDALRVSPPERAWGGNEGPLAWRAAALDAQSTNAFIYAFAGTNSIPIVLTASPTYSATTHVLTWPQAKATQVTFSSTVTVTVLILDAAGNTLQTLTIPFASPGCPVPTPISEYTQDGAGNAVAPSYYMTLRNRALLTQTNREFLIQPGDVSRSMEAATDLRVIASLPSVPAGTNFFKPHPLYLVSSAPHAHNMHFADGTAIYGAAGTNSLVPSAPYFTNSTPVPWTNWCNGAQSNYAWPSTPSCSCPDGPPLFAAIVPAGAAVPSTSPRGDWDTGPGISPDGAEINLPDAGTTNSPSAAYFGMTNGCPAAPTQRTPNALVPSPVAFGSLPAGINPASPTNSPQWRTLLFCPYPAGNTNSVPYGVHPGAASPPDHLILDNFWMPVVEPYPISICMATAGKINLNDQIAPFTYLHRSTALRALLDDLRIPAIPVSGANIYKTPGTPTTNVYWNPVDETATVAQIENRYAAAGSTDAYLSESEICTVPLVPSVTPSLGTNVATAQTNLWTFWNGNSARGGLTGDNLRELPYAQLYSRLTTRSNSYTVHVRVQVLQKLRQDPQQNVWNEGTDLVLGEWRGTYEIERDLSPTATAPTAGTPLGPYTYRVLSARRFAP